MFLNKIDFVQPVWRLTKYQKSLLPLAISLWNNLDQNRGSTTKYEFFKDILMASTNDNPLFYIDSSKSK